MSVAATSALAVDFTHTTATQDVTLSFTSGASPVDVTIPTGTYRMCLSPAASDMIRVMQAAVNAALVSAGRAETVTCAISAAGIFSITISDASAFGAFSFGGNPLQRRLGFTSAPASGSPATGDVPVWHLAILAATTGQRWQPVQPGGAERTNSGRVYTFGSPSTSWTRSLKVHFQPSTPTVRAARGDEATALYPDTAHMDALGSTATAREWSVLDVLRVAGNASCALALGTWQAIRTSTTERYWIGYVAPESLLSQAVVPLKEEWSAYEEWALGFVLPSSSPSGTRA